MRFWHRHLTRVAVLAVVAAITATIAGCQPLPHPFANDRPAPALLTVPDSLDIAVGSFEGGPQATVAKLPAALAQELLKHNIAASDQTTSKASYLLDGRIEERPDKPGQSALTVYWRLRDPRGNIVRERSDRLVANTQEWANGSDNRVAELAAAGAKDFATVLTDDTPKEQPGGGRIRVAIRKIAGAPGDGDTSLAASLNTILTHRDIQLVDAAQGRPDLAVDADIKVDPVKDGKQHVKIVWHVARAGGAEVGQVAQENDIPRGQLDGMWGDIAFNVAMAAEDGIMQLVARGAPPQKLGAEATAAAVPSAPASTAPAPAAAPPASSASTVPTPTGPPVPGNLDSPEVNLPPVNVSPTAPDMPKPLDPPDVPVLLPYRGAPIPH
jgi:hypothetical protein